MLECKDYCTPWGIPFRITPGLRPGQAVMINGGRELLLGEGGVLADKFQYGKENGAIIGPLTRLKRDNDRAAERAKREIHHAYAIASVELMMLQRELQRHGTLEDRYRRAKERHDG